MKKILRSEKIDIKLWLDDIEEEALQQARNLANLPFAFHHIAVMADAHFGYGMPIGGILATEDTIIPNAVGVDIGCGICALQTSLTEIDSDTLKTILGAIRGIIPLGFKHQKKKQKEVYMPEVRSGVNLSELPVVSREYEKALKQIGTLGGGNHFIEIQKGSDNRIWIMIHSGSRNLGYQVAQHYNKLAAKLNKKWKAAINPKWQLSYLPFSSDEGWLYFCEMNYCVDFALCNRLHMLQQIEEIFLTFCTPVTFGEPINIAHNYAAQEEHFKKEVIVHRKGATRAYMGEIGIIPGSQGSSSYIVEGKGNADSFYSCSHGAGRKLGRKQAQKRLNLREEIEKLDNQKILHSIRSKRDLDEAAGAYKDIETVMRNQADLVDIKISLQPIAVVKG